MARCPECGAWIWHPPQWFEEHVCPNCGAVLKLKASLGGFFLGSLEVVGHTTSRRRDYGPAPRESLSPSIQEDIGESYTTDQDEEASTLGEMQVGECEYCHTPIMAQNARFCSNCGASLDYGSARTPISGAGEDAREVKDMAAVSEQEENCIVCSLRLTSDDDVVWCPHCGGLAHRNHMLDWVRAKKCCPVCDQLLGEEFYS